MSGNLRQKLTRPSIWLRLVFMIVLVIAFNIAEIVLIAVVVFQFLAKLFTRKPNEHFTRFGTGLGRYLQQIVSYLTFASEEKPFPFSPWPSEPSIAVVPQDAGEPMDETSQEREAPKAETKTPRPRKATPGKTTATRKSRTVPKTKN